MLNFAVFSGAPGRIRTSDPQIRSLVLVTRSQPPSAHFRRGRDRTAPSLDSFVTKAIKSSFACWQLPVLFALQLAFSMIQISFMSVDRAMAGKQAKILSDDHVRDVLSYAACTRHPCRNEVLVLLSAKAGLRAGEIANSTWDMVADPNGQIGDGIALWDCAAKRRSGRLIPLQPSARELRCIRWRALTGVAGPVVQPAHWGGNSA